MRRSGVGESSVANKQDTHTQKRGKRLLRNSQKKSRKKMKFRVQWRDKEKNVRKLAEKERRENIKRNDMKVMWGRKKREKERE